MHDGPIKRYLANSRQYISGYPDQSFRPEAWITREDATVVLTKVWGLSAKGAFPQRLYCKMGGVRGHCALRRRNRTWIR